MSYFVFTLTWSHILHQKFALSLHSPLPVLPPKEKYKVYDSGLKSSYTFGFVIANLYLIETFSSVTYSVLAKGFATHMGFQDSSRLPFEAAAFTICNLNLPLRMETNDPNLEWVLYSLKLLFCCND